MYIDELYIIIMYNKWHINVYILHKFISKPFVSYLI